MFNYYYKTFSVHLFIYYRFYHLILNSQVCYIIEKKYIKKIKEQSISLIRIELIFSLSREKIKKSTLVSLVRIKLIFA